MPYPNNEPGKEKIDLISLMYIIFALTVLVWCIVMAVGITIMQFHLNLK